MKYINPTGQPPTVLPHHPGRKHITINLGHLGINLTAHEATQLSNALIDTVEAIAKDTA